MADLIDTLEGDIALIKEIAGDRYVDDMEIIWTAIANNPDLAPKYRGKNTDNPLVYFTKWVSAYLKGLDGRPSVRQGQASGTYPDTLIKEIYAATHTGVAADLLNAIAAGHATMMTLEKVVGDLLEEYLSKNLVDQGWVCCWGACIKAVDFCTKEGKLLQVKTSDNSENSSSNKIRNDTNIEHWCRRKSSKPESYFWDDLVKITGNKDLSENNFRKFVHEVLQKNPKCIYIPEPMSSTEETTERETGGEGVMQMDLGLGD